MTHPDRIPAGQYTDGPVDFYCAVEFDGVENQADMFVLTFPGDHEPTVKEIFPLAVKEVENCWDRRHRRKRGACPGGVVHFALPAETMAVAAAAIQAGHHRAFSFKRMAVHGNAQRPN